MQLSLQSVQLRRREETQDEEAKTVKRPAEDMPPPKRPRKDEAKNKSNDRVTEICDQLLQQGSDFNLDFDSMNNFFRDLARPSSTQIVEFIADKCTLSAKKIISY